jgi:choline dehydrogenase-like flavoprotein
MPFLNTKADSAITYDAIVIGSGISGGVAAKELCEKGLKTLVLESGRMVAHGDYPTAILDSWDMPGRGSLSPEDLEEKKYVIRTGFVGQDNKHHYINDKEHPYVEKQRFDWIRANQTGGRSLVWGRQCYRWSDLDFAANAKEGIAVDWPIRYKDIAPWYDHVERFVGVSGEKLGLQHLPDGQFLRPMDLNCLETHVRDRIQQQWPDRYLTIGRVAHVTEPFNDRGTCQYRNRCSRGCPYGAYYSSNAVALPMAEKTGNLTIRPFSMVNSIVYDKTTDKASGVVITDAESGQSYEYKAKVIFLCASAMGSARILLHSTSARFPNGMGNDSDQLGRNIMDHHYFVGAVGIYEGFPEKYYEGNRPNGIYIPRFRNIGNDQSTAFRRGYGYQGGGERLGWGRGGNMQAVGSEFKEEIMKPGPWKMTLNGFGECLPYQENRVTLSKTVKDKWGQPVLEFDASFKENELTMRKSMMQDAVEMLEASGIKEIQTFDTIGGIGKGIHEMGTARMGRDPRTSVLNEWNQIHAVKNVFCTDGACMTSSSCVNPSITYMAFTARAAHYAVEELNRKNL